MKRISRKQAVFAAAACIVIGSMAGIAGSTAATKSKSSNKSAQQGRPGPPGMRGGPPVHAEVVVLNKAKDGFITVTNDSGTVESVSGDQLTIKQGTKNVEYKTITLTIPSGAEVKRNFADAQLSDLKAGDHVHVSQSSEGTNVFAADEDHKPKRRHGRGGPPGPPPGAMQ
jgi:hypothetical protein